MLPGVLDCFYSYDIGDKLSAENWGRLSQIFLRIQLIGGRKNYNIVTDFLKHDFAVRDAEGNDLLINKCICK